MPVKRPKAEHKMTPARKGALRKATAASARARRGHGLGGLGTGSRSHTSTRNSNSNVSGLRQALTGRTAAPKKAAKKKPAAKPASDKVYASAARKFNNEVKKLRQGHPDYRKQLKAANDRFMKRTGQIK